MSIGEGNVASISIRRLEDDVVDRLRMRADREALSLEETARRILRAAVADEEPVGAAIRRIVGDDGYDLQLARDEAGRGIDFSSADFGDEG